MASGATGVLNEACQRLHQTGPQHEGQVQRPLAPTLHDLLQPRRMFLIYNPMGVRNQAVENAHRRIRAVVVGQRRRRCQWWGSLLLRRIDQHNGAVSAQEIDQYLDGLQEPKRATLARLRQTILAIVPEAEQGISYGVPAFKVRGKTIAGFAAFKNHLSYLPHSGSVFTELKDQLQGYSTSSGALRFSIDEPLPVPLVEKLIAVRLRQAFPA